MDITKPNHNRYAVALNLTGNELNDLKYILGRLLEQIKVCGNTHYNGDKVKLMKTITEVH